MQGNNTIRLERRPSVGETVTVEGEALRALLSWKPRISEAYTVIGPDYGLLRARLVGITQALGQLLVFEDMGAKASSLEVVLLQALPEKERMELVIQKTTELGVSSIVPFKSSKSTSLAERDSKQKKSSRWNDVALKAAKQCRRESLVEILPFSSYAEAIKTAAGSDLKLLLWERPGCETIKEALTGFKDRGVRRVSVMAGPEGGLSDEEVKAAYGAGFIPVSLGKRILRTETASIISIGLVRYELGE
ncbi:MAG: RNA methyltransferase [Deltaproteobacteria bacterium]|nr:RNA methyltransferase [Deltaproteobacteria bacterium]